MGREKILWLLLLFSVANGVVVVVAKLQQGQIDKVPSLFNFNQFKEQFNKHYASLVDELRRQKLFLARAFKVFISVAKFHLGQSDYYLSINGRSDRTPDERRRAHMHLHGPANRDLDLNDDVKPVTLEEVQLELEEIERRKEEPKFRLLARELNHLQLEEKARKRRAIEKGKAGFRGLTGGLIYLASLVQDLIWSNSSSSTKGEVEKASNRLPDEVFSDLTQSGCFPPVESQDDCGACYAFASLALFEHLYCRSTGHLLAFSKQFMVSCGQRLLGEDMDKCEGAFLGSALRFVDKFGFELAEDWPYEAQNGTCRLAKDQKGSILLEEGAQFGYVLFDDFDEYLKHRPILFSLNVPKDFEDYGGGVLRGDKCQEDESHAMLLVGHGREKGKEYYLFRNSYGDDWGDQGYLRFRKSHTSKCSNYMYGLGSQAHFPPDHFQKLTLKLGKQAKTFSVTPKQPHRPNTRVNTKREKLLHRLHPEYREDGEHDPMVARLEPNFKMPQVTIV